MSGSLCNKDQLLWSWRSNISCNTVSSFVKCAWYNNYSQFVVKMIKRPCKLVQFRSVTHSCRTLCDPMNFSTPGFPGHHHLPELAQTHIHWVCDAIQPSHPLSSPSPPALNLSQPQDLFKWVNSLHQVDKVLEFQHQHHSFQWTLRTDLLWMDWLDLLAVQGTLKSLLQHHSSKASFLQLSAFFIVELSHPYMTIGKTIALTRWTFVDKLKSMFFNMLSMLVITYFQGVSVF